MYVAGFNTPGFLPNPDVVVDFDTIEEAWMYLSEEIEHDKADLSTFDNYDADSLEAEILAFDATGLEDRKTVGEVHLANLVFWVTEAETPITN